MLRTLILVLLLSCAYGEEKVPRVTQNDGSKIPVVGLGTYIGQNVSATYQQVRDAIDAGYRHIDTSLGYGSEKEIGRALKDLIAEGKVKREELYVVSKLEGGDQAHVPEGIKKSLDNLGLTYLDLYLIHFPETKIDQAIVWAGMEDVHKQGLAKSIGVSNFNETQIDHILEKATVKPVTNQVVCHPYHNQKKMLDYLTKNNITLTGYSPLGGGDKYGATGAEHLLSDPKLISIGKEHNVTAAQVALKYQLQRNVIVVVESTHKKYIIENIDLFNFKLTDADIQDIDALNKS